MANATGGGVDGSPRDCGRDRDGDRESTDGAPARALDARRLAAMAPSSVPALEVWGNHAWAIPSGDPMTVNATCWNEL